MFTSSSTQHQDRNFDNNLKSFDVHTGPLTPAVFQSVLELPKFVAVTDFAETTAVQQRRELGGNLAVAL